MSMKKGKLCFSERKTCLRNSLTKTLLIFKTNVVKTYQKFLKDTGPKSLNKFYLNILEARLPS